MTGITMNEHGQRLTADPEGQQAQGRRRRSRLQLERYLQSRPEIYQLLSNSLEGRVLTGVPSSQLSSSRIRTEHQNPCLHPQFQSKAVCQISCLHCDRVMCKRGMKAILLGNTKSELFSTDAPPSGVQLVFDDYLTPNCMCKIKDAACLTCGNVIGYHVTQPCNKCLDACNNGHFWMFLSSGTRALERRNATNNQVLRWANVALESSSRATVNSFASIER